MTSDCIDMEEYFPEYKIGYEDPHFVATRDPWHKVIECRHGHISPDGGEYLLACTKNRRKVPDLIKSGVIETARYVDDIDESKWEEEDDVGDTQDRHGDIWIRPQDGSDGVNGRFHVKDARKVFRIMGAKRK